jgi:hypothetical protein
MDITITTEKEYIEKYPVTKQIMSGIMRQYGIDKNRYLFSELHVWHFGDNKEMNDVYYSHKENENVSLLISVSLPEIRLEQLTLSTD